METIAREAGVRHVEDVTHLNGALGRGQFNVESKGSARMPTPGVMRKPSCESVVHLTRHALVARWIPAMEEARRSTDAGRAERHGIMDRLQGRYAGRAGRPVRQVEKYAISGQCDRDCWGVRDSAV